MRRWGLTAVVALGLVAPAAGATKLVVTGHGWGHGVGMSQWGAYGFARHGWSYERILAHYYPGTQLAQTPVSHVRVLLAAGRRKVAVACPGTLRVSDATGRTYTLPPATYAVNAALKLPVGHRRIRIGGKRHAHAESVTVVPAQRALHSPLVFDCPSAPLTWNGRMYHGLLLVRRDGKRLSVVNSVDLEDYVRGVVGGEMPHNWGLSALEAQAVAARSYALATLHPNRSFDLFSDTRSQVYGGIAYETPQTNFAVQRTALQVLTWHGRVALTFFFSTSGGRTADVREVWPQLGDLPYLRSVSDPYDIASPHHTWQVVLSAAKLPGAGALSVVHAPDGRVTSVVIGTRRLSGTAFRQELGLRSTWFDVGELSLTSAQPQVRYGGKLTLRAQVAGVPGARLERRIGFGAWKRLKTVTGRESITVEPQAHTLYRLSVADFSGPEVAVDVAPQLDVTPAGSNVLAGAVEPATHGAISVWRHVASGWRLVAHPRLDARGTFHTPLHLQPGTYRVQVADDGRFASATRDVHVTSRLLATLGY
jgi:stage II sporulation protein D